jgi:hypothetical protein
MFDPVTIIDPVSSPTHKQYGRSTQWSGHSFGSV